MTMCPFATDVCRVFSVDIGDKAGPYWDVDHGPSSKRENERTRVRESESFENGDRVPRWTDQ